MKSIFLIILLCSSQILIAEPLATGDATRVENFPQCGCFWLKFKVSKDAKPGIRFWPRIRFVFNDETWIYGWTGCFPLSVPGGMEAGGDIYMLDVPIPAGKVLKFVDVVAVVGDPKDLLFGVRQGEGYPDLETGILEELKEQGGVVLRFPIKITEQLGTGQPTTPSKLQSEDSQKHQGESKGLSQ